MPSNKGRRFPAEAIPSHEVELLLAACGTTPTGLRNQAAIMLMWKGGLRCAEALSVRRADVDLEQRVVRVMKPKGANSTKGKKPRVLGLSSRTAAAIAAWLVERKALEVGDGAPLCCTRTGTTVPTSYIRELLPRLARKAGIERRVHAHALRHSFAFNAVMAGQPIPWIRASLGHSSILQTQTYIDHLAPADVIAGMQAMDD